MKEVENIRKKGMFGCDILITTAVLDNGINIKDSQLRNIVLLTNDEVSFKQMLGRRRFQSTEERLNIFICSGDVCKFRERANWYRSVYWKLCDRRDISLGEAYEKLRNNYPGETQLLSFYAFNGFNHHCHELTIESVRMRGLYCEHAWEKLLTDSTFFLREQLSWLGKEVSGEWLEQANVNFSQADADAVGEYLAKTYDADGILDKQGFEELKEKLMEVAAKIEPQIFGSKSGNISTVNNALKLEEGWRDYEILSFGDRIIYYELRRFGEARNNLQNGFTVENLKQIVDEKAHSIHDIWTRLFETDVPSCLMDDEDTMKVFINGKLKNCSGLEKWILKSSGREEKKKIVVGKRPNSAVKK